MWTAVTSIIPSFNHQPWGLSLVIEGRLEVKLPTIWTLGKVEVGRVRDVFPMICGSGGSKSTLAKAAGAEPAGQMRDEKLHAVVARSAFPSQNVQNTPGSDHFWKLRCRKSARRCGAKHISKSKCTKLNRFGPLKLRCRKVHAVGVRSTFPSQKYKQIEGSDHCWAFRCRFAWQAQGIVHLVKSEQNVRVL